MQSHHQPSCGYLQNSCFGPWPISSVRLKKIYFIINKTTNFTVSVLTTVLLSGTVEEEMCNCNFMELLISWWPLVVPCDFTSGFTLHSMAHEYCRYCYLVNFAGLLQGFLHQSMFQIWQGSWFYPYSSLQSIKKPCMMQSHQLTLHE